LRDWLLCIKEELEATSRAIVYCRRSCAALYIIYPIQCTLLTEISRRRYARSICIRTVYQ